MTLRLLQGFEHIKPTTVAEVHIEPAEINTYLGFLTPTHTDNWFIESGGGTSNNSGPIVIDTDARISGQCLQIGRPDAGSSNDNFNGRFAIDLRKTVSPDRKSVIGFAVKFNKAPSSPFPILRFMADNGTVDAQQTSLWIGTSGQMFFSSTDVGLDSLVPIVPVPITSTLTEAQTLNFEAWNYIEVELNHAGTASSVDLHVNNIVVLDNVRTTELSATTNIMTTSIGIVNPQNHYFAGDNYIMYLDDIYVADGFGSVIESIIGPQHIILLAPDSTDASDWTIVGSATTAHETVNQLFDESDVSNYLENSSNADSATFGLPNLPADVVSVSAVMVSAFMDVDTGSSPVRIGIENGSNNIFEDKAVNTITPRLYTAVFQQSPAGTAWTPALVNSSEITIEARP